MRQSASCAETLLCISGAKADTSRCSASTQLDEWMVASTRCPVSAALSVRRIVSGSRISPSIRTSGPPATRPPATAPPRGCVADLTLADEGLAGSQHVLDGAFDGDDVLDFTEVDFLQQRGERRGLARASRARDENQPVAPLDEAVQRGVKVEPFERRVKGRQQPHHKPDPACGPQDVDAAAHLSDHLGEVEGAALDEGRPAVPDGRACQFHQGGSRHWLTAHAEFSPHPEGHRHPSLKVQVGGAGLARQGHVAFQRRLGHQPNCRRVRGAPRRGRALSSQTSLFSPASPAAPSCSTGC